MSISTKIGVFFPLGLSENKGILEDYKATFISNKVFSFHKKF